MPILTYTMRGTQQQHGQTMVFALVFIVVILIGLVTLFNTGQLTRHKMEVQNAADAAAYSAALLTARELNFMAYTNRAMIANQVSIGQFSAFRSWSQKYAMGASGRSIGITAIRALPYVGSIFAGFLQGTMRLYHRFIAQPVGKIMAKLGDVALKMTPVLQTVYQTHQTIMRVATQKSQIEILPKIIEANAKGATLSNFGALAALASATEQQVRFLSSPNPFTSKQKEKKKRKEATRRFAAFVNDSRDPWTLDRTRTDLRSPTLRIPLPGGEASIDFGFDIRGGSALRFNVRQRKDFYDWTTLDTVGLSTKFRIKFDVCIIWWWSPSRGVYCAARWKLNEGNELGLPLGGASYELAENSRAILGPRIFKWANPRQPDGLYGDAVNFQAAPYRFLSAFEATAPFPGGRQEPLGKYKGLPFYTDIDPERYPGVTRAPLFLVSVRKNANELRTSDRIDDSNKKLTVGQFEVKTKLAGGSGTNEGDPGGAIATYINEIVDSYRAQFQPDTQLPGGIGSNFLNQQVDRFANALRSQINNMGNRFNALLIPNTNNQQDGAIFAIAAARVYFKNPDAPNEKGSTFSPYWQVRLQPVDDNIRKWSVITQTLSGGGSVMRSELKYVDPDPDSSGVKSDSELIRLKQLAR